MGELVGLLLERGKGVVFSECFVSRWGSGVGGVNVLDGVPEFRAVSPMVNGVKIGLPLVLLLLDYVSSDFLVEGLDG